MLTGVSTDDGTTTTAQEHVYNPDGTVLAVDHPGQAYDATYVATDALGSVTDTFADDGTPTSSIDYEPFGDIADATDLVTDPVDINAGYTGAYFEPATGDYDLRARDYNTTTGRFNAVDPAGYADQGAYISTYAYVENNPNRYTDPSGLCPWCVGAIIGGAVGAVVGGVSYAVTTDNFSLGGLAGAAGTGAVVGAVAGATFGLGTAALGAAGVGTYTSAALAGGLSGTTATITGSYLSGSGFPSAGQLAVGTATGALSGVAGTTLGRLCAGLRNSRPSNSTSAASAAATNAVTRAPQVLRVGELKLSAVPKGAVGTPTTTGKGLEYAIPRGTPELSERVASIRIMDPVTTGKHVYPNGYAVYMNAQGQRVNPLTGQMIHDLSDPFAHIPLP